MIYSLLLFVVVSWLPAYTVATQLITNENSVPHTYIVTLAEGIFKSYDDETTQEKIAQMIQGHGEVIKVFKYAMQGFSATLDDVGLQNILDNPDVTRVEQDKSFMIDDDFDNIDGENLGQDQNRKLTQGMMQSFPWGLDTIDDEDGNLDGSYNPAFGNEGEGVTVYVIDTGILDTHEEFEGRAKQEYDATNGSRFEDRDYENKDCNSHGTHVAGIIGSKTYGVAKKVDLVGVKIANCKGKGSVETMLAGIEWVMNNAEKGKPAVVNISMAISWAIAGVEKKVTMDRALKNLVDFGLTTVVAAGNSNANACQTGPADSPSAITVGATANFHNYDYFATCSAWQDLECDEDREKIKGSNWGPCIDILAPGSKIKSTITTPTTSTEPETNDRIGSTSGTSQAAPHVSGAVALYLGEDANLCPSAVTSKLLADSLSFQVQLMPEVKTPNRMLYVGQYSYASDIYYMKSSHGTYISIDADNNGTNSQYNVLLTNNKDERAKIIIKYLGNDQYALRSATHHEGNLNVPSKGRDKQVVMRDFMEGLGNADKFYMTRLNDGRVTFRSVQYGNYLKANKRQDIIDTQKFVGNWEKFTIVPAHSCK